MKKTIILLAIFAVTCLSQSSYAQVRVHVNLNLQPLWGPTGYDYVQYYYIPDIDAYYDVQNQDYVYFDDGRWVTMRDLPPRYRGFDLYNAHKVVVNEPTPWIHNDRYRNRYASYRGRHDQAVIRDSREERYWANPGHPQHGNWHGGHEEHREWGGNRGHGEGHGGGHGEGHDHGDRHDEGHHGRD